MLTSKHCCMTETDVQVFGNSVWSIKNRNITIGVNNQVTSVSQWLDDYDCLLIKIPSRHTCSSVLNFAQLDLQHDSGLILFTMWYMHKCSCSAYNTVTLWQQSIACKTGNCFTAISKYWMTMQLYHLHFTYMDIMNIWFLSSVGMVTRIHAKEQTCW